jgi:hypothetical protein
MPSFTDLISNPASALPASTIFANTSTTLTFAVNLAYIIIYGLLVISVVFNFLKLGQKLMFVDYEESYERFKAGIQNILFAVLGIVVLVSLSTIFSSLLSIIGVADADNIYKNIKL